MVVRFPGGRSRLPWKASVRRKRECKRVAPRRFSCGSGKETAGIKHAGRRIRSKDGYVLPASKLHQTHRAVGALAFAATNDSRRA
jgi:hypothetical protein